MNGNITVAPSVLRAQLRRNLKEVIAHARRQDIEAARRSWRFDRDFAQFIWLNCARRILRGTLDRIAAEQFISEAVPALFQIHAAEIYPDPTALNIVDQFVPPFWIDGEGNVVADYRGGFLFFGPTGAGKTRAAFRMLSRWAREQDTRFKYFSAPVLKRQLADAARAGKAHQVIDQIMDDDQNESTAIFIDDLSQARFTPSFAENLFELIDRIHRERRTLVVTVQTTGAALIRKWCADDRELTDTAEAIARRLRDYCVKIRFSRPNKTAGASVTALPPGGVVNL